MGFAPEEIVVWTGAASRVGLRSHLGLVPGTRDPLTFQITFRATRLEMNTILMSLVSDTSHNHYKADHWILVDVKASFVQMWLLHL